MTTKNLSDEQLNTSILKSIKEDFNTLAKAFLDAMEGNDNYILEAYEVLERLGLVDEDGFETGEYL